MSYKAEPVSLAISTPDATSESSPVMDTMNWVVPEARSDSVIPSLGRELKVIRRQMGQPMYQAGFSKRSSYVSQINARMIRPRNRKIPFSTPSASSSKCFAPSWPSRFAVSGESLLSPSGRPDKINQNHPPCRPCFVGGRLLHLCSTSYI